MCARWTVGLGLGLVLAACGSDEIGSADLQVSWAFENGDCASNGIQTVRITWTPTGDVSQTMDFACAAGMGTLGQIDDGGSYSIVGQGLDSNGVVVVESFGQTASFPDGRSTGPVPVTLRPKASNVTVTWNGCPRNIILPYMISLYEPPEMPGGALIARVKRVQESCTTSMATLEDVAPGDYVVELDSQAVSPMIVATQPVTVVAGQDVTVVLDVP